MDMLDQTPQERDIDDVYVDYVEGRYAKLESSECRRLLDVRYIDQHEFRQLMNARRHAAMREASGVTTKVSAQMPRVSDSVNHPNHYNQYRDFEVIDVCEQLVGPDGKSGFNLGNAFKYIARAGWKNPEKHVEDLEKAKFYIQREIDRIENEKSSRTV